MSLNMIAGLGMLALIALLLLGMNIGLCMFLVGFVGYAVALNFKAALGILMTSTVTNAMTYSFSVIPLFILMGQFAFRAGLSDGLFEAANTWFGRVKGGLCLATIVACATFGAICGSLAATAATMAVVAMPEMRKRNYDAGLSVGCIAAGGTLGTLIPPSTPFILYGIIAQESIGKLFSAGIVPGILMAVCFCGVAMFQIWRNPEMAPAGTQFTMKQKLVSLKGCIPIVLLFGSSIGGMFTGIFSATEAAGVGAFLSFVFLIIMRRATWENIKDALIETLKTSGMTLCIVLGAYMLGYFLAVTKLPMNLAGWVAGLAVPPIFVIAVIILIYAVMGCFMDGLAMTLLTVPIFLPIIKGLGYDPIWFGVVIVMVQNLGAITPPVGMSCYVVAGAVKDVPLMTVFKGTAPMIFAFMIAFILVVSFPQLSLWLPNLVR